MNQVTIMGRLGQAPEVKEVNGTTLVKFSVATTKSWTDKQGERQKKTNWHNCVAWGKTGEVIAKYHDKGDGILVQGEIETRTWETDTGEKRSATEVVVNTFHFVPSSGAIGKKGTEAGLQGQQTMSGALGVPNEAPTIDQKESLPF